MSEQFDLLIRNGTVVTPEGEAMVDVAISDGVIVALLPSGGGAVAAESIDATGLHVLPGVIDIHFHIRAPAFPERGTVESETRAAAAGGITTLFEMPISKPCCNTAAEVRKRREHFAENALINFGLYAAPGDVTPESIAAMVAEGIIGFKIFTTPAPAGRADEFYGLSFTDEGDQFEVMRRVAGTGIPLVVHAESAELLAVAARENAGLDPALSSTHLALRPDVVEAVAVAKLLEMNIKAGAKLHIAHVTCAATVEVLRRYAGTSDFSAETCPHYLVRTEADVARVGVFGKVNPPIRYQADQDAIWQAIADGIITHVTTDHASFSYDEKMRGIADFPNAPPGSPGSEMLLLIVLDAVARGRITLAHAVALLSGNAAKRFNLGSTKGALAIGADADLVLVDLSAKTTIDQKRLFTHAREVAQLYDGETYAARIEKTIASGRIVYDGAEVKAERGMGHYVSPAGARTTQPAVAQA